MTAKTEITHYLTTVSYRLFGKITPNFTAFKEIYQKSGIDMPYDSYMSFIFFASFIAFASAFCVGATLHRFLFNLTLFQYFAAVLMFSFSTSLAVPMALVLYPLCLRHRRGRGIDANLVYTAGQMGVLSSGGISIERIFEQVAQVERYAPIRDLAKRFFINIKLFGLDSILSLEDVAVHSPSETFSKILTGIINTVKTSGDLKSLLIFESKNLLHAKREQLKKTLGTLTVLAEIYITSMIIAPILFIIMLTVLSIMGNVMFGLSTVEQMNLLVFFGLPVISIVFIVIFNSALPEEE